MRSRKIHFNTRKLCDEKIPADVLIIFRRAQQEAGKPRHPLQSENQSTRDTTMNKNLTLSITLMSGFASSAFAAPVNMREGNWEIETSMKMERMPFPMPPTRMMHCFTRKDLEGSSKTRSSEGGPEKKKECEMKDITEKNTFASWKLACRDGTSGSGEAAYKGDSYSVNMKMFDKKGREMIATSVNGKRIGNCK